MRICNVLLNFFVSVYMSIYLDLVRNALDKFPMHFQMQTKYVLQFMANDMLWETEKISEILICVYTADVQRNI